MQYLKLESSYHLSSLNYLLHIVLYFHIFIKFNEHLKMAKHVFVFFFGRMIAFNDPYNPGDGYFCIDDTCMVHVEYLRVSIFTIHNFYGPISPKNL